MPKSPNQKLKLLYLAQILQDETDENHPLTVQQLIARLAQMDISAERKSIYDDIDALQRFGLDILTTRRQSNAYYVGERRFQLPELKLLVDAVQASKFITAKKSRELIKKLGELASQHDASLLQRQLYFRDGAKTMNETIYYNVDALHTAILQNRKVEFRYFEWIISSASPRLFEKQWRHQGRAYRISPWGLLWDSEYYYLVAYDTDDAKTKHYRVDKMESVTPVAEKRDGQETFENLDWAEYTRQTFGMFGGEETEVTLRFSNHLIGVVVDRFGKDVTIRPAGDGYFSVTVKAVVSGPFLAWLLSFGAEAEALSPFSLREALRTTLHKTSRLYAGAENESADALR